MRSECVISRKLYNEIEKRKTKGKKEDDEVHDGDGDEKKASGGASSAAVFDSDSIDRLNERLKKLYDITY